MKIMPKWRKFLEFLTIFDKAPINLLKAEKKFNFGRDLVQKCSKIGQNVQISSASFKKSDKTQQNFQKLAKIFEF